MSYFVKADVLSSVRKRYSMPVAVFAEKVKTDVGTVQAWEQNGANLSTAKMELIASTISCHWSVLLREDPLPAVDEPRSKRVANGHRHSPATSTLVAYREANRLLDDIFLSDLPKVSKELQIIIDLPKTITPEKYAIKFRELIGYDMDKRGKLRDQRAVYSYLVEKLEKSGVFVSEQDLDTDDIRGFLISKDSTFLIVISSNDKFPASRLFTLLHEVGHILRGSSSSACDLKDVNGDLKHGDTEERFCDSFAADVLMPEEEFRADKTVENLRNNLDDDLLGRVATHYRTSYLAVVRRLYTLNLISYTNYTQKTKAFFDDLLPKILAKMKRPKSDDFRLPRSVYVNREIKRAGKSFTEFVIGKYSNGAIGSGEAKRLLGVDTLYLVEIQKTVGTGK
jgi:Zn-dependent peptidase ImmA (M78 family)